jgi:hypothetical protein
LPRGGPRNATPGKSYQNRTDLGGQNVVGPQPTATGQVPIKTAPGQAQGQATAQANAQKALRMSGAPTGMTPPAPPSRPLPPVTPITAESELPEQSIFDGAPIGGGSNILNIPEAQTQDNIKFDSDIRAYSQSLRYVASLPGTSAETKQAIATLLRESDV